MKYNHVGFIGFTTISEEEDPENLAPYVLRAALLQRIINLDADDNNKWGDWQAAIDFGESYQEDES